MSYISLFDQFLLFKLCSYWNTNLTLSNSTNFEVGFLFMPLGSFLYFRISTKVLILCLMKALIFVCLCLDSAFMKSYNLSIETVVATGFS